MSRGLYIGLPDEFAPPDRAARRIAALDSVAERLALFERVPARWRAWVLHETKRAIAVRIVSMPEKLDRQDAISHVPEEWAAEVKALVLSFWSTRHLREERVRA